jgi:IstB-like ATP binding protein
MKRSFEIWPEGRSLRGSATFCSSTVPGPARATLPSRSRGPASETARGRFFNVVDLVNRLESETRQGQQGRLADYPARLGFIALDELGYLPFARPAVSCCSTLVSRLYERTSIIITSNLDPPLRNHRNRQRKLARQEPRLIPPIRSPALAWLHVCRLRSAERWTILIADRVPFGRRSRA